MTDHTSSIMFYCCVIGLLLILEVLLWKGLFRKPRRNASLGSLDLNRLVYRDQLQALEHDLKNGTISVSQYEADVAEIEHRILQENQLDETEIGPCADQLRDGAFEVVSNPRWVQLTSKLLLLFLPVIAVVLYCSLANPSLRQYSGTPEMQQHADRDAIFRQTIRPYLKESPKDVRAWVSLSNYYADKKDFVKALSAMDKAFEYSPDGVARERGHILQRVMLMLDTQNPMLREKALSEIDRALRLWPDHEETLKFAGMAAFSLGDYARAVRYWSALLELLPPESSESVRLIDAIAEARNRDLMNAGGFFYR